jgi:osmotically inducible protein OsmC
MAAIRRASASWDGDLLSGHGVTSAGSSGLFRDLAISWGSRTEAPEDRTSPEELLAAAHASCYAMALAGNLKKAGTPPEHLDVTAEVTFDKVGDGWSVVSSALMVRGRVPGADDGAFRQAAEAARDGCPISKALAGNVKLSVEPSLVR